MANPEAWKWSRAHKLGFKKLADPRQATAACENAQTLTRRLKAPRFRNHDEKPALGFGLRHPHSRKALAA